MGWADFALSRHSCQGKKPQREYFDGNPCQPRMLMAPRQSAVGSATRDAEVLAKSLGVTIEAR